MTLLGKIFNAIHDDESAEISSIDEKLSPSINDLLLIEDSEDGNNKKSVSIGNLPSSGGDYSGFGEVFVNLFSGSETTDENNWKSLGASEIDTAKFGFDGYFEAVLSSSDDAGASELRLFNLTTNAQIGDILEVNGEVSFVSEQITLTGGVNIYEAQLRSPDGYYAVCKNARVSFYKFILNAPDASEDGYVAIAQSGDLTYIGGETDGYVLTWNAGLNSWEPQEPTGTGSGGTLAETLALGNTTGSNDIIVSIGDVIIGGGTIVASTPGDVVTPGALTLGIAAGSGFDDGSLTLDGDGGLVQITAGEGYGLGDGGSVDISAGSANGVDSNGGDVYLTSGLGIGTGRGGNVQCYVMPSDGSGAGGEFQVYIGQDPEDLAFKVDAQGDGYFYNNLEIDGKLTVSGLIDPTGLVLSEQLSVPGGIPSTGNYTLWVRDDGYALLTNSNGETTTLSGGEGILQNLSDVLSIGNSANSQLISDLLDPINAQDAATKNYIDGYVGGLGGDLSGSLPNPEVTDLTITGEEQGSVLYFDGTNWAQLPPNTNGYVLTTHGTGADPTWEQSTASGGSLGEVFVNLFTGNKTINDGYWVAVGGAEIDTNDFNIDGYFEAVLSSSNPAGAAHLRLFNVTTNSQIGDILEVYDSIDYISEPVTLTSGSNIYEAQLRSPDGYWVVCYNARISFSKYALAPPINTEDGYVAIAQSGDLIYIGGETDGYVLTWNSGLNTWEPQTPTINVVGEEQGSVLYFDGSNWVQLPPGQDGYALITHDTGANPTWGEVASSAPITTVFGRIGDIVATVDDYSASQIDNDSTVPGEQVSDALEYLDGYIGGLVNVNGDLSGTLPNPSVIDLSITGEEQGSVLYFDGTNWVQLTPGEDGYALTTHGTGADPTWGTDLLCENITVNGDGYFGGTAYFNQWPSLTPVDGYITVDFSSYQQATVTLNENPIYITITPPSGPTACRLLVIQDAGGANTISWEEGSKPYAPDGTLDIASAANARTLIGIVYDGIDFYAVSSQPMTQVT